MESKIAIFTYVTSNHKNRRNSIRREKTFHSRQAVLISIISTGGSAREGNRLHSRPAKFISITGFHRL